MSDDTPDPSISYEEAVEGGIADSDFDDELSELGDILSQRLLGNQRAFIEKQIQLGGFEGSASQASNAYGIQTVFEQNPADARALLKELKEYFANLRQQPPTLDELKAAQGPITPKPVGEELEIHEADATKIEPAVDADHEHTIDVAPNSVDLIVTSPPYWQKRDYGIEDQLGQEESPEEYAENLVAALDKWRTFLRPTGSIFLNVGDTYQRRSITGIPGMFVQEARKHGWTVRNEILWAKSNGIPSSANDRLANRHEYIYHLTDERDYFYDLFGYSKAYGNGSNGIDVWEIAHDRNTGDHLAPYPRDLVRRAVTLACPPAVCPECGHVAERILERDPLNLDQSRQQARRALEIYNESDDLTKDHLYAIQKVGISDAGKAKEFQDGAGRNAEDVQELADEAKEILGGYFREFTFPKPTTKKWELCDCDVDALPGRIMDPFAGSGTTLEVAEELGYRAVGVDLDDSHFNPEDEDNK